MHLYILCNHSQLQEYEIHMMSLDLRSGLQSSMMMMMMFKYNLKHIAEKKEPLHTMMMI